MRDNDEYVDIEISIPIFQGTKDTYLRWKNQMEAYAILQYDCHEALLESLAHELPTSAHSFTLDDDDDDAIAIRQAQAIRKNTKAMALLSVALQGGNNTKRIVSQSKTQEWQHGLAWQVMKQLDDQFLLSNQEQTIKLQHELASMRMTKKQDPNEVIDKLESIQAQLAILDECLSERELVMKLWMIAPKDYASTLVVLKHRYGNDLSLDQLRSAMNDLHGLLYGRAAGKRSVPEPRRS